jgi:hypothetical protein
MDKTKFDYYWRIALLIVLILGTIYMFWEFKQIDKKGMECAHTPFEYGIREAEKQGLYCYYTCLRNDVDDVLNKRIELNISQNS